MPYWKSEPLAITRHRKRVDAEEALKECYAEVDARDAGICFVTGRYTSSGAVDPRVRREHHHIVSRSLDSRRRADPDNVITVCAQAHQLIEAGWIEVEGVSASKPLLFHWATHVKPRQRPFVIVTRRRR